MINGSQGLPPDITRLLQSLAMPSAPKAAFALPQVGQPNPADILELSSSANASFPPETQNALVSSLSTVVSHHQAMNAVLLRVQTALERMLTLAQLSQDPKVAPEIRAKYAAEFTQLQRYVGETDKPSGTQAVLPKVAEGYQGLYGVPIDRPWRELLDHARVEQEKHLANRPKTAGAVRWPRISIVLPVLASAENEEETIETLLEQEYPGLECIIVARPEIRPPAALKNRAEPLVWKQSNVTSESEALQQGFELATGDILGWARSGDYFYPHSLQTIASVFLKNRDVTCVLGRARSCLQDGRATHQENEGAVKEADFNQPGFWRRSLWDQTKVSFRERSDVQSGSDWLGHLSQFAPVTTVNAFLVGAGEGLREAESKEGNTVTVPEGERVAPRSAYLELGSHDLIGNGKENTLDQLLLRMESALKSESWSDGLVLARQAAACEPNSRDLLELEALCEYHHGRIAQAQSLVSNVLLRFGPGK